jgi:hypothetical protein
VTTASMPPDGDVATTSSPPAATAALRTMTRPRPAGWAVLWPRDATSRYAGPGPASATSSRTSGGSRVVRDTAKAVPSGVCAKTLSTVVGTDDRDAKLPEHQPGALVERTQSVRVVLNPPDPRRGHLDQTPAIPRVGRPMGRSGGRCGGDTRRTWTTARAGETKADEALKKADRHILRKVLRAVEHQHGVPTRSGPSRTPSRLRILPRRRPRTPDPGGCWCRLDVPPGVAVKLLPPKGSGRTAARRATA